MRQQPPPEVGREVGGLTAHEVDQNVFDLVAFLIRRTPFATLERWQTNYLPVYAGWAWIVVLLFPPLFHYA